MPQSSSSWLPPRQAKVLPSGGAAKASLYARALLLFFGFARVLRLFSAEDRSSAGHLLPERLRRVVRLL
ncbi:MAG: hypothetical protein JRN06_07350 [Nitrososphaerota archaeon]|nr:hypothetical protein [Nitrososphaerota archaeon]